MLKSNSRYIILSLDLKVLKFNVFLTIEGDYYYYHATLGIELALSVSCSHTHVGEKYSDKK